LHFNPFLNQNLNFFKSLSESDLTKQSTNHQPNSLTLMYASFTSSNSKKINDYDSITYATNSTSVSTDAASHNPNPSGAGAKESSSNTSRTLSRSNSMNSLNDSLNNNNNSNSGVGVSTAEQKRRCNIQHGFDRLQILVPSLRDKNAKISKALMLQKTSEYIKELQKAREKRNADLNAYRKEIEELSNRITDCQNQLPANGVAVYGSGGGEGAAGRNVKFEQKFNNYVKEKTLENYKFYLFSIILMPLFDSFISHVNTTSRENIEKSFQEWQEKYCNLTLLRPSKFFRYV
jgi:MAX-like protein X